MHMHHAAGMTGLDDIIMTSVMGDRSAKAARDAARQAGSGSSAPSPAGPLQPGQIDVLTTLHPYPMRGPYAPSKRLTWYCDNQSCIYTKHGVFDTYQIPNWKSTTQGSGFVLCDGCVRQNQQTTRVKKKKKKQEARSGEHPAAIRSDSQKSISLTINMTPQQLAQMQAQQMGGVPPGGPVMAQPMYQAGGAIPPGGIPGGMPPGGVVPQPPQQFIQLPGGGFVPVQAVHPGGAVPPGGFIQMGPGGPIMMAAPGGVVQQYPVAQPKEKKKKKRRVKRSEKRRREAERERAESAVTVDDEDVDIAVADLDDMTTNPPPPPGGYPPSYNPRGEEGPPPPAFADSAAARRAPPTDTSRIVNEPDGFDSRDTSAPHVMKPLGDADEMKRDLTAVSQMSSQSQSMSIPNYMHGGGAGGGHVEMIKQGWMEKQGEIVRNWKRRYFILHSNLQLNYYANMQADSIKGVADLKSVTGIERISTREFSVVTPERTWMFRADTSDVADSWIDALEALRENRHFQGIH